MISSVSGSVEAVYHPPWQSVWRPDQRQRKRVQEELHALELVSGRSVVANPREVRSVCAAAESVFRLANGRQAGDDRPRLVEFTRGGRTIRMMPVLEDDQLFFVFRDTTAGKTTYPAARFLYADLPKAGLSNWISIRLTIPPCAFTPYATCPLPPKENRLNIAVEAGEKKYSGPARVAGIPRQQGVRKTIHSLSVVAPIQWRLRLKGQRIKNSKQTGRGRQRCEFLPGISSARGRQRSDSRCAYTRAARVKGQWSRREDWR